MKSHKYWTGGIALAFVALVANLGNIFASGPAPVKEQTTWFLDSTSQLVIEYTAPSIQGLKVPPLAMPDHTWAQPYNHKLATGNYNAICIARFPGTAKDPGAITWKVWDVSRGDTASSASTQYCQTFKTATAGGRGTYT